MILREIEFEDINTYKILVGQFEENLKSIARMLGISVSSRGTKVFIKGEDKEKVEIAEETIKELYREIKEGLAISRQDVEEKVIEVGKRGKRYKPKEKNNGEDVEISRIVEESGEKYEGKKEMESSGSVAGKGEGEEGEDNNEKEVYDKGERERAEGKREKVEEDWIEGERKTKNNVIITTYRGKKVVPKTVNQEIYVEAIRNNDIVFAFGPAGTGKTYLAVAMAISYLKTGKVAKIVLTRPAVEAGEKIGYLPGGILEKVDPFMRPIYDCLYDILDYREISKFMERGVIEIIPIAFMRGRTVSDSFIIVDEAQNLTYEQVKMTLTRMGLGSKMVLTADMTQIDIQKSGLIGLKNILEGIEGIAFVNLTKDDVVRHPVVSKIILAFEEAEKKAGNLK